MIAGQGRQLEGDEELDREPAENTALSGGEPKRFQRFPLIPGEVVIEFRAHVASKELPACVLQRHHEWVATTMSPEFDEAALCKPETLLCDAAWRDHDSPAFRRARDLLLPFQPRGDPLGLY